AEAGDIPADMAYAPFARRRSEIIANAIMGALHFSGLAALQALFSLHAPKELFFLHAFKALSPLNSISMPVFPAHS
ncbi:MAG TPA: hypothetical protein PLO51_03115, partial [Candidatus Micrarchaeota archaeon]|nr:hypothetical protein [Candidatus Micrarchaeota archaeon]